MRFLILITFLLITSGVSQSQTPDADTSRADSPESKVVMVKLSKIVLPHVNFEKLDITAVVEFLNQVSKEQDPYHTGVKFRLDLPAKLGNPPAYHREISITLTDVPLGEAVGYISQQTNLIPRVIKGVVVFGLSVPEK